jgi:hypothetical protein
VHHDFGHVADGGDEIIVQVLGAAGDELLHERKPQALGDAAVDLALDQGRVHGPSDVVRGDDAADLHGGEHRVDLDLRELRPEAVGRIRHALALGIEGRRRRVVETLSGQHRAGLVGAEAREIDGAARRPVLDPQLRALQREPGLRAGIGEAEDSAAQILAGQPRRVAGHEGLSRGGGLPGVRGEIRVADDAAEGVGRQAHRVRAI